MPRRSLLMPSHLYCFSNLWGSTEPLPGITLAWSPQYSMFALHSHPSGLQLSLKHWTALCDWTVHNSHVQSTSLAVGNPEVSQSGINVWCPQCLYLTPRSRGDPSVCCCNICHEGIGEINLPVLLFDVMIRKFDMDSLARGKLFPRWLVRKTKKTIFVSSLLLMCFDIVPRHAA